MSPIEVALEDYPEAAAADCSPPRGPNFTARVHLSEILESSLSMQAMRVFSEGARTYPVHRVVRRAVRMKLPDVLDTFSDVAPFPAKHRSNQNLLQMAGDGIFVQAGGFPRTRYSSVEMQIWAPSELVAESTQRALLASVAEHVINEPMFTLDWRCQGAHGMESATFEEIAGAVPLDEAYPCLPGGVAEFFEQFLDAEETVLVLQGPPGTGKTRLVRALLAAISVRKGSNANALYTGDTRLLQHDSLFMEFLTGAHDAMVLEDIDRALGSREKNDNPAMHLLLTSSDGLVSAQGRKIVFTTNLQNVGDIDAALVRPGRCFARLDVGYLSYPQARALLHRLESDPDRRALAVKQLLQCDSKTLTVAEVYRAVKAVGRLAPLPKAANA